MNYKTIKTWEAVCKIIEEHPVNSLPYPDPKTARQRAVNGYHKMDVTIELFNSTVPKQGTLLYEPYFDRSGVGFSFNDFDSTFTYSTVGARLSLNSPEHARHLGTHFLPVYREFMTIIED